MVHQTAQQRAEHAAREGHQTAQAQQIAQQGSDKGYAYTPPGPQQHGAQHIDHVLHRSTFAAEHREAEHAAHHTQGTEHTGQRQFFCRNLFHEGKLLSSGAAADSGPGKPRPARKKRQSDPSGCGRDLLVSSHAGTRLPIAVGCKAQGAPPQPAAPVRRAALCRAGMIPPQKMLTKQKQETPGGVPPVKNRPSMTSYGGIIRIRLKGRRSIPSSQPASQAPLYLVRDCILHPLRANCKGHQIRMPSQWSISCWMIWAVQPVKVRMRGLPSAVSYCTLMLFQRLVGRTPSSERQPSSVL